MRPATANLMTAGASSSTVGNLLRGPARFRPKRRLERGHANTFLILGNPITLIWMSVSGYLIAAVGYRWMLIIEGLPAAATPTGPGRA